MVAYGQQLSLIGSENVNMDIFVAPITASSTTHINGINISLKICEIYASITRVIDELNKIPDYQAIKHF